MAVQACMCLVLTHRKACTSLRCADVWSCCGTAAAQVAVLLARMEVAGVAFAPAVLSDHRATLAGRLAAIKGRATQLVGYEFNLSSSSQLAQVLYQDLKLAPPAGGKAWLPAHEIEACTDGLCALSVVLSDRMAHLFLTASTRCARACGRVVQQ